MNINIYRRLLIDEFHGSLTSLITMSIAFVFQHFWSFIVHRRVFSKKHRSFVIVVLVFL